MHLKKRWHRPSRANINIIKCEKVSHQIDITRSPDQYTTE
jgi:hypothetical protein